LTLITQAGAPEPVYAGLSDHFTQAQIVDLTLIIAQMNAWNRVAVGFGHGPDIRPE
jgi:alkylhydroperoxidase family enzyme